MSSSTVFGTEKNRHKETIPLITHKIVSNECYEWYLGWSPVYSSLLSPLYTIAKSEQNKSIHIPSKMIVIGVLNVIPNTGSLIVIEKPSYVRSARETKCTCLIKVTTDIYINLPDSQLLRPPPHAKHLVKSATPVN